jgi:hypothetical protein
METEKGRFFYWQQILQQVLLGAIPVQQPRNPTFQFTHLLKLQIITILCKNCRLTQQNLTEYFQTFDNDEV